MSEGKRANRRGKDFERAVAKALGGTRPRGGNRGTASSDIEGTPWSIEVTRAVKVSPSKWQQAVRNACLEGREPLLIYAAPRQPLRDALVVCRFEVFRNLWIGEV